MNLSDWNPNHFSIVQSPFVYTEKESWQWIPPPRNYWNLWICLKGTATITCNGSDHPVHPWTGFLFPPAARIFGRTGRSIPEFSNFGVHLHNELVEKEDDSPPLGIQIRETEIADSLIRSIVHEAAFHDSIADSQVEFLTASLIGLLLREERSNKDSDARQTIRRQMARIQEGQNLFRPIEDLAREAGVSRIHYGRIFRKLNGVSPNRFLIDKRMERARLLLSQSNWTIESIANRVGYDDSYFFSRQFSKENGISPSKYRARSRQRSGVPL